MQEGGNVEVENKEDHIAEEKIIDSEGVQNDAIKQVRMLCEKTLIEYSEQRFAKILATDDEWIERFLKANKSVKKAVSAIEGCLEWRRKHKVDTFREWEVKPAWKEVGMYMINGVFQGKDRMGRPLIIVDIAQDLKKVVRTCGGKSNFLAAMNLMQIQFQEYIAVDLIPSLRENQITKGFQCTAIIDLSHFGYSHVGSTTYSFMSLISTIQDSYYPLCIKKSYIVKAPRVFGMAWKVLKKILPANITESVHFCGKNFLPELLEVIDKDTIPRSLGGESDYKVGQHIMQLEFEKLGMKKDDDVKEEVKTLD